MQQLHLFDPQTLKQAANNVAVGHILAKVLIDRPGQLTIIFHKIADIPDKWTATTDTGITLNFLQDRHGLTNITAHLGPALAALLMEKYATGSQEQIDTVRHHLHQIKKNTQL